MQIEMLDDDGNVTETVVNIHRCVGDLTECRERPAICEDNGEIASAENPVYCWTTPSTGIDYFACGRCLAADEFARLVP